MVPSRVAWTSFYILKCCVAVFRLFILWLHYCVWHEATCVVYWNDKLIFFHYEV